jgi:hypothetical protein
MVRVVSLANGQSIGVFALSHHLLDVKEPAVSVILRMIDQDRIQAVPTGDFDRKRHGIGHTNQVVALERLHIDFSDVASSPGRNALTVGKDMHFISLRHRRNNDFLACGASGNRRDAVKNFRRNARQKGSGTQAFQQQLPANPRRSFAESKVLQHSTTPLEN